MSEYFRHPNSPGSVLPSPPPSSGMEVVKELEKFIIAHGYNTPGNPLTNAHSALTAQSKTIEGLEDKWRAATMQLSATDLARLTAEATVAELRAEVERLTGERDLALAHDTQPYPTAEAYEKVCAALSTARERAIELERVLEPFARVFDAIPDFIKAGAHEDQHPFAADSLSIADFRRASAALSPAKGA